MSPRSFLLLAPLLGGCLTATTVSSSLERRPTGLETLADPQGEHLAVEEVGVVGGVVELGVTSAQRELEVERFELERNSSERREWKRGGKAGRNALWLASATAGWVGAFGVSWEGADGQRVQLGGLGGEAQSWQGVTALLVAASGVGLGTQQTLAVGRDEQLINTLVATERVLRQSRSLPEDPLAGFGLDLRGEGLGSLRATTDSAGRASVSALELPVSAWSTGLDIRSEDGALAGRWKPSDDLRSSLLELPADWEAPFHASLLDEVAELAREASDGGLDSDLPLSELSTADGARGSLEPLPLDEQLPQAQAWLAELEPLAAVAAAQRERVHFDWLRNAYRMTEQLAPSAGASVLASPEPSSELLTPLFQPMDLFRQLPATVALSVDELSDSAVADPSQPPRVLLIDSDSCSVFEAVSVLSYERVMLTCEGEDEGQRSVLISTERDLRILQAEAWAVVGLLTSTSEIEAGSVRSGWLPTVTPLYAASLGRSDEGSLAFIQHLDEQLLLETGVMREIGL